MDHQFDGMNLDSGQQNEINLDPGMQKVQYVCGCK